MKHKLDYFRKFGFWLSVIATTVFFGIMAKDFYETQNSQTKYIVGMLYFMWLSMMTRTPKK